LLRISAAPILASALLLLASSARPQKVPAASVEDRRKALQALFQQFWDEQLEYAPEFASTIGDKRFNDRVTDLSVKAYNDHLGRERALLLKLAAIDPTGLNDQDKISQELLIRQISEDDEASTFKEWEMPINQMGGIYSEYPQLVEQLSFETVKDYDDWVARLKAIPDAFDQVITNMSIGIDDHRVPPRFLLEKTLGNVKQLAEQKAEDSPLALPLKKFPAAIGAPDQDRLKKDILSVISKQVLPAYGRLAHFIEATYIPAGRAEPGIWAIPDGRKYYEFLIRQSTTTSMSADQIHQVGLDEVKRNESEELAIAQKLGFADLKTFRGSLKTNAKLHAKTGDELLQTYKSYLTPMQAKLPTLFGRLPKSPFEVLPVPQYLEKTSAAAYYEPGTPTGSRPGRLRIDAYNAADRNLFEVESTAYHEGLPGHHMQIAISQEQDGVPEFRKYGFYGAFVEGWALYSERLGKELGLYQDPYSDYGRLESDNLRAIRLVVDTGVHAGHWTRQQMVDFFHDHSSISETEIQAEVDRYIAWPAQALSYKVGQLKILELRDRAKKALGDKFDIRAFHDEVLDAGGLPLDVLDERINAWIKQGGGVAKN
jgi:uncharacterized protein (DUF885 family)